MISNNSPKKILIADDEFAVRDILSRWLKTEGYECVIAPDGEEAWKLLKNGRFALLISDLMMPEISGIELLSKTKKRQPDLAVIMVTAVDDRTTAIESLKLGAYGYVIKPFDKNEILINVANALERRRLVLIEQEYQHRLEEEVRAKTAEVRQREEEIVFRLAWAVESHSKETGDHIRRIGVFSSWLAQALGWEHEKTHDIRLAATMHDIGKVGIPDGILFKPGELMPEEFEVVKNHVVIGARLLENSNIPLLQMAREIVLHHHEKWDGSGYPYGLAGEEISESGRIVAVVDAYDAITDNRVYSPARSDEEAIEIMTAVKGKHFDPKIFDLFLPLVPEFRAIREQIATEE